tara:strand:+ start:1377 stop:1643 length:267 start_codon:yes stop_codon:yes gene_type:complete
MRFKLPGMSVHVRLLEEVATVDDQYHIFDSGLEYEDGSVDSLAVGGAFATAKSWVNDANSKAAKRKAKKAAKKARKEVDTSGAEPTAA